MNICVKFFASMKEIYGKAENNVEVPESVTPKQVLDILFPINDRPQQFPSTLMFAVNKKYQQPDFMLKDGDELVFIPPVSGG